MSELENALENRQLHHLLQIFAEGADFTAPLPSSVSWCLLILEIILLTEGFSGERWKCAALGCGQGAGEYASHCWLCCAKFGISKQNHFWREHGAPLLHAEWEARVHETAAEEWRWPSTQEPGKQDTSRDCAWARKCQLWRIGIIQI